MKQAKRVFVIVIDSLGIGVMPDGEKFGDVGVNTLGHISESVETFRIPALQKLGIANLTQLRQVPAVENPLGYQAALRERSNGKDTMTGHWEIMGVETKKPFKTFTEHGFPKELIDELEKRGVATLWLEVRASNAAAIALYESLGFNEATIRRNYYPTTDGREDAIIMALPISM